MNKNNSNAWIWAIIVVIVGGILFFVFRSKQVISPTITDNSNVVTTPSTPIQDVTKTTKVENTSISYADALIKYAGRRIQLDKMCQAYPNNVTYKDNTGIMIDNRSPQTRTVKIGTTFTIKPYGFKIVVLPDIYLKSKTLLVNCDKSINIATILIQE